MCFHFKFVRSRQDHWNGDFANPGLFLINYSLDGGRTFVFGASLADDSTPSLGIFTILFNSALQLPVGPIVLQVVYKTNNPSAPAAFYQCADGLVVA